MEDIQFLYSLRLLHRSISDQGLSRFDGRHSVPVQSEAITEQCPGELCVFKVGLLWSVKQPNSWYKY